MLQTDNNEKFPTTTVGVLDRAVCLEFYCCVEHHSMTDNDDYTR